jgi:hypothetical protein
VTAAQSSVSPAPTPTDNDVATACRAAVAALTAEASAIDDVRAQVDAAGEGPTRTAPGYAAAAARQRSANAAAGQAWAAFEAAGLTARTDQVITVILSDVNDFVGDLPGAVAGDQGEAAEIWSALKDRPKVLREKVVPAVARECAGI